MSIRSRHIYLPLVLALLARLATYPLAGIKDPAFYEYGHIATNLIAGNGYSTIHWVADATLIVPSAWMPPGQVLLTAFFFAVFGKGAIAYHVIFLLNALLGTAAVYVLGRCTKFIWGDDRSEQVALYAAALFPPFISATASWGVASSALLLNTLLIYCALRFSYSLSTGRELSKRTFYFGLIGGTLALFRAEAPLTVVLIMLALMIFHRQQLTRYTKHVLIAGLLMLAILSPWMIANYIRFDELILGSTSGGFNLWRGNNPSATGGGWDAKGNPIMPTYEIQQEVLLKTRQLEPTRFEREYSRDLADRATTWIDEHKAQAAMLSLKKALLIWTIDPYHPSAMKYVHGFFQLIALGLGINGLVVIRARGLTEDDRRWLWIVGAATLATTLVTMVFFSLPRYQIFLVGLYFPFVAIGLHALLQKRGLLQERGLLLDGGESPLPGQN